MSEKRSPPLGVPPTLTIYEARSTSTERSTESTSYVDHPDFHLTQTFPACKVTVLAHIFAARSVENGRGTFELHIDDVSKGVSSFRSSVAGALEMANIIRHFDLSAGSHTIKIKWKVADALGGTINTPGWNDASGLSVLVIS